MSGQLPDPEKAAEEIHRIQAKIWRERPTRDAHATATEDGGTSEHERAVLVLRDMRDRMLYGTDYKALGYALERLEAYPELLETLKALVEVVRNAGVEWCDGVLDAQDRARAAIAKAEGRES